jgi:hypothetical protein
MGMADLGEHMGAGMAAMYSPDQPHIRKVVPVAMAKGNVDPNLQAMLAANHHQATPVAVVLATDRDNFPVDRAARVVPAGLLLRPWVYL